MELKNYIRNNYFSDNVLRNEIKNFFDDDERCNKAFNSIKKLYNKHDFSSLNESQLEKEFIQPVLENILNYSTIVQEVFTVNGQRLKPDYILFADEEYKNNFYSGNKKDKDTSYVLLTCEAKAFNVDLDIKTIEHSPHRQLFQYNLFLKIRYGILTNGREWRFYDYNEIKAEKIFFGINLEQIINDDNYEAFQYFYYIFRKEHFVLEDNKSQASKLNEKNKQAIEDIEEDLKNVIYGDKSIIEKIGKVLYRNYKNESLNSLFNHSVMFAYRLLFIAYFETKYNKELFEEHEHYKHKALFTLYKKLIKYINGNYNYKNKLFAYQELCDLFEILDKGSTPYRIPLLNGGLFDSNKAPLFDIKNKELFTNEEIFDILKELLIIKDSKSNNNAELNIRNFSIMSVTHIGNIYEGLLQYTFRVSNEKKYYLEYSENAEKKSGYFEIYDYEELTKNKKNKKIKIHEEIVIEANSIYLVNSSNSRKMSASYYTPSSLSNFMVNDAVKIILENERYKKNILNIKVLDNACGSGHFLVEFLDVLTENVYLRIFDGENKKGDFYYLYETILEEKEKIKDNLSIYNLEDLEIDELQVLKRMFKCHTYCTLFSLKKADIP